MTMRRRSSSSSSTLPSPHWCCCALVLVLAVAFSNVVSVAAFTPSTTARTTTSTPQSALFAVSADNKNLKPKKKGYEPKWKKLKTLAEEMGDAPPEAVGLKGTISVVFKQGDDMKRTMAYPNQPLKEVAIQAGQFIKYGCGKGECGTCECLIDGKWIRPCQATVPADANALGDYVVTVKATKAKVVSSGKFYSAKSFVLGFWNNLLGMVGFVKYRRAAKKNWEERQEYEDLIKQKTMEKKRQRELELQSQQASGGQNNQKKSGGLSP